MSYPVNDNNSSLNINKDYTWDQEDVAELFGCFRKVYEQFQEDGEVMFGAETITTEEELKSKFADFLNEEEIAGIFKGGE